MLGLSPWISLGAVIAACLFGWLAFRAGNASESRSTAQGGTLASIADVVQRATHSRWAPIVAGAITATLTWWVWGSLTRAPVVHDEAAYLLQARIFARWRWAEPTPPLPQFFEQLYVLLQPALASKYPPGTSLLMVPGVWLGAPGLSIVLMNGAAGALLFALARRLAGGVTAALTWILWVSSFPVLYFHAMYLSEVPSGVAWLGAWYGLIRWRASGRQRDLVITAGSLALCAVTRPLTAVALSIVVGCVLVSTMRRGRAPVPSLRRAIVTLGVAAAMAVALVALWSWRTTGDPRLSPLTLYTRRYVPFDALGFGATPANAPAARLPWDQRLTSFSFYDEHRRHTPGALPANAALRARMVGHDMWYDWRAGLALLALLGLVGAPAAAWIGLGATAAQLLLYLLYAHPPAWSVYYSECLPALAFVTALGVARASAVALPEQTRPRARALVAVLLIALALLPIARTVQLVRHQIDEDHSYFAAFDRLVPRAEHGVIVFVRYARTHNDNLSLVRNVPDLASAPLWTVYDRGAENDRLRALAPARAAYLFDEATWSMRPLPPLATTSAVTPPE